MADVNILAVILPLLLCLFGHAEAYRYYYYSYYYYYYYTYYSYYYYYSGYSLSSGDKGMIAGIVIGVFAVAFIIVWCVYYCRIRARQSSGSSRTIVTTGQPVVSTYPQPVYPGVPMTTTTSGAPYSQPPPPYQPPGGYTTDFQNVDSRSKTNLIHNEFGSH